MTNELMTNEYLEEKGYHKYQPTVLDNEHIVARFQKRFDDDIGKKYFIDIIRWSNEYIPESRRGDWWTPYTYEYETQVTMPNEKPLNLHFFCHWTLEEVEKYMEEFFEKMKPNYYETWCENDGGES